MVWMLVREKKPIIIFRVALSDSATSPAGFRPECCSGIRFSLGVWRPSRGSPAFLSGSWAEQLGMQGMLQPCPHGWQRDWLPTPPGRSAFGMNRSALGLHSAFAVLLPFVLKLFCLWFFYLSSSSGRDRGKRESRTDILISAVLPDLFWVITRGVRGKQSTMFF